MALFTKQDSERAGGRGAEATLSIVSSGTQITGDLECAGVLKVEGRIDGSVIRAKQVMLAKDGSIRGDVTAQDIVVGGLIDGNVSAAERLELQPTAVVNGDIVTKSIVVMEGARINGAVRMTELALVSKGQEGRDGSARLGAGR